MGEGGVTPREDGVNREGADRTAGHKPQVTVFQIKTISRHTSTSRVSNLSLSRAPGSKRA